jgi:hypothetical protein
VYLLVTALLGSPELKVALSVVRRLGR